MKLKHSLLFLAAVSVTGLGASQAHAETGWPRALVKNQDKVTALFESLETPTARLVDHNNVHQVVGAQSFTRPSGATAAMDAAVSSDGSTQWILWGPPAADNRAWLTKKTPSGTTVHAFYNSSAGNWYPLRVSAIGNLSANVLWKRMDTATMVQVWRVTSASSFVAGPVMGPYPGLEPVDMELDGEGNLRVAWQAPAGEMIMWKMDIGGNWLGSWTLQPFVSGARLLAFAPLGDQQHWTMLWSHPAGGIMILDLDLNSGGFLIPYRWNLPGYVPVGIVASNDQRKVLWAQPWGTGNYALQEFGQGGWVLNRTTYLSF
jgi:hypothetical protein